MPKRTTKHHRRCRSNGGTNDDGNISKVTPKEHEAWHTLFGNLEPEAIARRINAIWLDPDWEMVALRRDE